MREPPDLAAGLAGAPVLLCAGRAAIRDLSLSPDATTLWAGGSCQAGGAEAQELAWQLG